ncbi:hypothetical protein OQA88_12689 [Cercophora sp. LCS_1]
MTDDTTPFALTAGLTDLRLAGDGLEFAVYRATSPRHSLPDNPDIALRIPKATIFSNVNDPHLDAKHLLQQELTIYAFVKPSAVPVPEPYELLEVNGKYAMMSEYIESDGSTPSPHTLGRGLAQLHLVQLPAGFTTVACEGMDVLTVLPRRITHRLAELRKYDSELPDTLSEDMLKSAVADLKRSPWSLLRMDWRPANLRTKAGEIVGVVDFSNALVGPAAVDIFRVLELLDPGPEFLAGYAALKSLTHVSRAEELCLRLDAAVMLALVFISEVPDEQLAARWTLRVRELYRRLQDELLS